jgi:hypothetical protein
MFIFANFLEVHMCSSVQQWHCGRLWTDPGLNGIIDIKYKYTKYEVILKNYKTY